MVQTSNVPLDRLSYCECLHPVSNVYSNRKDMSHVQFWIKLATQMLTRACIDLTSSASSQQLPPDAHFHECHFLGKIRPRSSGKPLQHECIVCSYKKQNGRNTTTHHCKQCKVVLAFLLSILITDFNGFVLLNPYWTTVTHLWQLIFKWKDHSHISLTRLFLIIPADVT